MTQNYNMLSSQLTTITEIISLSELHGLITAYVCIYSNDAFNYIDWPLVDSLGNKDESDADKPLSANHHFKTLCLQMCSDTRTSLDTHLFDFTPLMPESGPSYFIIQELGSWCRGFSYAMIKTLSDMSTDNSPNYASLGLSELGVEAIHDIIEISQVNDDSDEDEVDALIVELQEYLRIATQTIFEEINAFKLEQSPNENEQYH